MCRIVAYLGPRLPLAKLLTEAPHGLLDQSHNAREMTGSNVAGDGWGVGWFAPEAGQSPGLLKSILPMWSDENAKTVPRGIVSGSIVGHVRLASPNIETCFINTPLYVVDNHLWTINGMLEPWPGSLSKALRDRLEPDHEADLRGATDGEMLGALWRTHRRRSGRRDAAESLRLTLRTARDLTRAHRGKMKTNIILADASRAWAVRFAEPGEPNTLYVLEAQPRWRGGAIVASEPLDDGPGWREVSPDTLVRVDAHGVHLEPLDLDRAEPRGRRQTA